MASVTATSSILPPAPLKLGTDVAADWERFRSEWRNYETATELDKTTEKLFAVRLARHSQNAWARHVECVESSRAKWNLSHTAVSSTTASQRRYVADADWLF